MTITEQKDISKNINKYFDMAFDGEPVMIPWKENRNVVILSEAEYQEMAKAKRNIEYLNMLNESDRQLREGRVIVKTMEELEAMAEE